MLLLDRDLDALHSRYHALDIIGLSILTISSRWDGSHFHVIF